MTWLDRFRKKSTAPAVAEAADPLVRARDLLAQKRFRETCDLLEGASTHHPLAADALVYLGTARLHTGEFREAAVAFEQVLSADPDDIDAAIGRGKVSLVMAQWDDAARRFGHVLAIDPHHADALLGLGEALLHAGDAGQAETALRAAAAAEGAEPRVFDLLGLALLRHRGPGAALDAFAEAWRREQAAGIDGSGFHNYAITLGEVGRLDESLRVFAAGIANHPSPFALFTYGMARLRAGDAERGWPLYEFRWLTPEFIERRPHFGFPSWTGQRLAGKRILLLAEQGYGDTMQFVRYAKELDRLGADVVVFAHKDVAGLLRRCPGVRVPADASDVGEADFHVHMMSLPALLGTASATAPGAVPYLTADEEAAARWRDRLGADDKRRIGVVWAGSHTHARDRHRSMPLPLLESLVRVEGTQWFSLQKPAPSDADLQRLRRWGVADLSADLSTFEDTAAAICALDLVITVDTSVAHLAGALDKPVWLMLPTFADFRWMEGRADSPWYPSMRIFRQRTSGDWSDVIRDVAVALRGPIDAFGNAPPTPASVEVEPAGSKAFAVATTEWGMLEYVQDGSDEAKALALYAEWQPIHLEALLGFIGRDSYVLEAAPGVGSHTLAIRQRLDPAGHLLLLEARQVYRRVLGYNLAANRQTNQTIVEWPGGAAPSLDGLAFERLALLKLGGGDAARSMLEGARDTLWRLRPIVVATAPLFPDAHSILRDCGYRLAILEAPLFRSGNFARETKDAFAGRVSTWTFAQPEEASPLPVPGARDIP